jgi:hypothetical protein
MIIKINIFLFIFFLLNNFYLPCFTKCVMYDACHSQNNLQSDYSSSPLSMKWNNCYTQNKTTVDQIDFIDESPLKSDHAINLYKKICPMLYKSDKDNVCCAANQLMILESDLERAETIIGSCSSCFLNFRTLWCYMACAPNQHEFLRPVELVMKKYTNLTDYLLNHHQYNIAKDNVTDTIDDDENAEDYPEDESQDEESPRNRRAAVYQQPKDDISVITTIAYYLNEDFLTNLIKSC